MSKYNIVILDDEADIRELVCLNLQQAGYAVNDFANAESFLQYIKTNQVDLLLLDLMLPDMDGLDICKKLKNNRETKNLPIIMLTAKAEEIDKIIGLELGADDYVTKPFSPRELIARIKALLRRRMQSKEKSEILQFNQDLIIDLLKIEVLVNGVKILLTSTEFKILEILATNAGIVYNRQQILEKLWQNEKAVMDRTIDVHIKRLRDKLGTAQYYIQNIRGIGYKFAI